MLFYKIYIQIVREIKNFFFGYNNLKYKFLKYYNVLTDKKINTSERKSQLVLLDANKSIMALLPSTCSEAHKISQETTQALAIHLKSH